MAVTLSKVIDLVRNMGWRYVRFRAGYELLQRTGSLKKRFPASPAFRQYISPGEWKGQTAQFFFRDREGLSFTMNPVPELKDTCNNIEAGKLLLFNSVLTDLGRDYDWVTNPDTGYRYDAKKHWTEIADYSKEAGDIKYTWEKSRFSYLYDIIRYDYHYGVDKSAFVFGEILSWIKSNPVNCGPNYRCSQETSLRVLNWTFALHYYRNSPHLTEEVFSQVQYAIYWQLDHVYKNINFSRIAVRNNHAITETLMLYLGGLLYPSLPGAAMWKEKGKKWFEEEVAYQVYEDGTFLQFSMNYHRIVVQLLTWAIVLSERNGERFSEAVYDRARKSVVFLRTCMVDENGWLPNYGANDGALFFKLNNGHYRDYRGSLQALAVALGMDMGFGAMAEDIAWYGLENRQVKKWQPEAGIHSFAKGGYYVIREQDTLTFIKCGSYKDRPSQADNLHMDVWYKGENVLLDAGTYKYNTDAETMRYFSGTRSHNTVMLDDNDQMLKGGHFIWFYWTQCVQASIKEEEAAYMFDGTISAFRYVDKKIVHKRTIIKQKGAPVWEVKDEIIGAPAAMKLQQLWHVPYGSKGVSLTEKTKQGGAIPPQRRDGWYSSLYGQKEKTDEYYFSSEKHIIYTELKTEVA